MTNARMVALPLVALSLAAGFPASGQSVVSTRSGVVYFFVGSTFLGDEPLEQKFGRFPDIGEGRVLRTALGRAEVLLTPGVFLRLDAPKEETQAGHVIHHGSYRQLSFMQKVSLPLPYVVEAESVRRLPEVS